MTERFIWEADKDRPVKGQRRVQVLGRFHQSEITIMNDKKGGKMRVKFCEATFSPNFVFIVHVLRCKRPGTLTEASFEDECTVRCDLLH